MNRREFIRSSSVAVGAGFASRVGLCAGGTPSTVTDRPLVASEPMLQAPAETTTGYGLVGFDDKGGYRHHVAFVRGNWSAAIVEAFSIYLGWEIDRI